MAYTAGEAARSAGISTATVTRALKRGTISGTKGPGGAWQIEPAEFHRVFPPLAAQEPATPFTQERARALQEGATPDERGTQGELAALRDALADARNERDKWREMAERLAIAPPPPQPRRSLWQRLIGR